MLTLQSQRSHLLSRLLSGNRFFAPVCVGLPASFIITNPVQYARRWHTTDSDTDPHVSVATRTRRGLPRDQAGAIPAPPMSHPSCTDSSQRAANGAKGEVLPGVDAAKRCTDPSVDFPATYSEDEPLSDTDPRVVWREHFSEEHQKPYYQNVQTNEVMYTIPHKFKTSFPRYYTRLGYEINSDGTVRGLPSSAQVSSSAGDQVAGDSTNTSTASSDDALKKVATESAPSSTAHRIKIKLATYGAGGLFLYVLIHGVSFLALMTTLYIFRIDLVGIARSYGFNVKMLPKEKPNSTELNRPSFWKTFLTAAVINKLSSPIHMLMALAIAPFFARRLEPITHRLIGFFKRMKTRLLSARASPS